MINLLPLDQKKQIRAGRSNVLLARYNLLLIGVLVFLIVAIGITYIFLTNLKNEASATISDNASKAGAYHQVEQDASEFRAKLADSKSVLDSQTSYSKVILNIADLVPNGAALTTLKLDPTSFTQPTTLKFNVKGGAAATKLKDGFTKSPLFTNVQQGAITQGSNSYPYSIEFTMTISKDAAK